MVGILLSYWGRLFSEAMLVSGRVLYSTAIKGEVFHEPTEQPRSWQQKIQAQNPTSAPPNEGKRSL